jgi:hypothetical protein
VHLVIDANLEGFRHVLVGIPGILCEGEVSGLVEIERNAIVIGSLELFTPEGCVKLVEALLAAARVERLPWKSGLVEHGLGDAV